MLIRMKDITLILSRIEHGDPSAADQLLPLLYRELRDLATAKMARESPDHTLQATGLVHEAYLRLVDVDEVQHWNSRGHFFAAAAEAMRRILVDYARQKRVASEAEIWNASSLIPSCWLLTVAWTKCWMSATPWTVWLPRNLKLRRSSN